MKYRATVSVAILVLLSSVAFARGGSEADIQQPLTPEESADALLGEQAPRVPVDSETTRLLEQMGMLAFSHKVAADDFMRPALAVETRSLSDFSGSILLVNFWGSWCAPCREEMPSMQALYETMAGTRFDMLAVNVLETREIAAAFVEEFGLSFPIMLDRDGGLAREFGVRGFPSTYVVDAEGFIVGVRAGFHDWSAPEVVEATQALVALIPADEE